MDVANGGTNLYGGFHRVFGGHSIVDVKLWKDHGFEFATEVFKDSLTTNGVPYPGIESLARAKMISPKIATAWGSLNIGEAIAGVFAAVDSCKNIKKLFQMNL